MDHDAPEPAASTNLIPQDTIMGGLDAAPEASESSGSRNEDDSEVLVVELFHAAVKANNISEVKRLLAIPSLNPNAPCREWGGYPIVTWVANTAFEELLQVLIDCPKVDLDTIPSNGHTSLILAALEGSPGMIQKLLEKADSGRLDVDFRNRFGHTAFYCACSSDDEPSIQHFLDWMREPGHELELDIGAQLDPNIDPLCKPTEKMKAYVRSCLEEMGKSDAEIPSWLREIPVTAENRLVRAICEPNMAAFRAILAEPEADTLINAVDEDEMTPLIWAAAHGDHRYEMVCALLPRTREPNHRDMFGRTAHYYACSASNKGEKKVVHELHKDPRVKLRVYDSGLSGVRKTTENAEIHLLYYTNSATKRLIEQEVKLRAELAKKKAKEDKLRQTLESRKARAAVRHGEFLGAAWPNDLNLDKATRRGTRVQAARRGPSVLGLGVIPRSAAATAALALVKERRKTTMAILTWTLLRLPRLQLPTTKIFVANDSLSLCLSDGPKAWIETSSNARSSL